MTLTDRRGYLLNYPATHIRDDADVVFNGNAGTGTTQLFTPANFIIPNEYLYIIRGVSYILPATATVGLGILYIAITRGTGTGIRRCIGVSQLVQSAHNFEPFIIMRPGEILNLICANTSGAALAIYASVQIDILGI